MHLVLCEEALSYPHPQQHQTSLTYLRGQRGVGSVVNRGKSWYESWEERHECCSKQKYALLPNWSRVALIQTTPYSPGDVMSLTVRGQAVFSVPGT